MVSSRCSETACFGLPMLLKSVLKPVCLANSHPTAMYAEAVASIAKAEDDKPDEPDDDEPDTAAALAAIGGPSAAAAAAGSDGQRCDTKPFDSASVTVSEFDQRVAKLPSCVCSV